MDTTFNVAVMIVLSAIFSVLVIEYLSYLYIKSASAGLGRYASLRYLKQELGALSADWRLRRMAKRKGLNIDTMKDPEGQIVEMAKARCASCDSLDLCENRRRQRLNVGHKCATKRTAHRRSWKR